MTTKYFFDSSNYAISYNQEEFSFSKNGKLIRHRLSYESFSLPLRVDTVLIDSSEDSPAYKDRYDVWHKFTHSAGGAKVEKQYAFDNNGELIYDLRRVVGGKPYYIYIMVKEMEYDTNGRFTQEVGMSAGYAIDEWTQFYDTAYYCHINYQDAQNFIEVTSWERFHTPCLDKFAQDIREKINLDIKKTKIHDTLSINLLQLDQNYDYFSKALMKIYNTNDLSTVFSAIVKHTTVKTGRLDLSYSYSSYASYDDFDLVSHEFLLDSSNSFSVYYDKAEGAQNDYNTSVFLGIRKVEQNKVGKVIKNYYFRDSTSSMPPKLVELIQYNQLGQIIERYNLELNYDHERYLVNGKYKRYYFLTWEKEWHKEVFYYVNSVLKTKEIYIQKSTKDFSEKSPLDIKYKLEYTQNFDQPFRIVVDSKDKITVTPVLSGDVEKFQFNLEYWN